MRREWSLKNERGRRGGSRSSGSGSSSSSRSHGGNSILPDNWGDGVPVVDVGSTAAQWPKVCAEEHHKVEYTCLRGSLGCFRYEVGKPEAKFLVREYLDEDVRSRFRNTTLTERQGLKVAANKSRLKQVKYISRRLMLSQDFIPKSIVEDVSGDSVAPYGNRLEVAPVDAGGLSCEPGGSSGLLAFYPRGQHSRVLGASLVNMGGGRHREESEGLSGNDSRGTRDATLDMGMTIHQVQVYDYRRRFGETRSLMYAARTASHLYCGRVKFSSTAGESSSSSNLSLELRNCFSFAMKSSLLSHVCLSPHWPEISFGTCCGKVCSVDLEAVRSDARTNGVRNAVAGTVQLRSNGPVYQAYGLHPRTLVCCSESSVLCTDLRSPGSDRMYRHKKCKYSGVERMSSESGLSPYFAALSDQGIHLFDERYMQPLRIWAAPKGSYLLSSALKPLSVVDPSLRGEAGLLVASGDDLADSVCYPFSAREEESSSSEECVVSPLLDVPTVSAHGPGLRLGHSSSNTCTAMDSVRLLDFFDSVRHGDSSPLRATSLGRDSPDPKVCIGLKVLSTREEDRFLLCSLSSDFGITISSATLRKETDLYPEEEKDALHCRPNVAALEVAGGEGSECPDEETELLTLEKAYDHVSDVSAYEDLGELTRRVAGFRYQVSQRYPPTAYEILHDNPTGPRDDAELLQSQQQAGVLGDHHHSQLKGRYGGSESRISPVHPAVDVLSTVLKLDEDAFFGTAASAPAQTKAERESVQQILSKSWDQGW
ncbi:hypothetical protein A3770_17p80230 [Chloropicon primus]|uniref:Uncharacterized protein n=2 Tax=Chloropicon primus TaxID=1764295 RepID=A0A5B8N0R5_9CHLO|nr:hypothetical protein A3770_17p80230 [Chloropicon primus]|eukprot:QDZ25505.1 hypothetical protein A3770_17p80230 [Chloropicon primus]